LDLQASPSLIQRFRQLLLAWFDREGRSLPWRKSIDSYEVLVAEMLLQRTPWWKVKPVYGRFVTRWPSVSSLAGACVKDVEDTLAPLGLARRASRMIETAKLILEQFEGKVPQGIPDLLSLPGVGPYTARAVANFWYERPFALVDGVSARVYRRVFGLQSEWNDPLGPEVWELAGRILPKKRSREFNWAVIDVASFFCKPRRPKCPNCPVRAYCEFAKKPVPRNERSETRGPLGGGMSGKNYVCVKLVNSQCLPLADEVFCSIGSPLPRDQPNTWDREFCSIGGPLTRHQPLYSLRWETRVR
jgi:A/G-specific adenine glycosylase